MADLDDFFAKKDRKKFKTKKFATTEEVVRKLEDTTKKAEKLQKKERSPEDEDGGALVNEQDEWREFEEEKKDYSENFFEHHQGDAIGSEVQKKTGPWKRINMQITERECEGEKKIETIPRLNVALTATTYIPPHMRNQPQQPPQFLQPGLLKSKMAPDIHNEEYFPRLVRAKSNQLFASQV